NLYERKLDIGVVEGIVGVWRWDVTVEGFSNHAGTTAMDHRHDALLSAARFVQMVNHTVRSLPGSTVGTVGRIQVKTNEPNVIPGRVIMSLELRDLDAAKVHGMYERIERESLAIGRADGTTFRFAVAAEHLPAISTPAFRDVIDGAAKSLGLSTLRLPS